MCNLIIPCILRNKSGLLFSDLNVFFYHKTVEIPIFKLQQIVYFVI